MSSGDYLARNEYEMWDTDTLIRQCKEFEELVEQLKQALRKCSPWDLNRTECCFFCDGFSEHADDCEYVRLIK